MSAESIKTFVTFDTESTGLPHLEHGKTKITELALIATPCEIMAQTSTSIPRVAHKLTLCINPFRMIQPVASNITGLVNEMLENEQTFNENLCNLLNLFFERLQPPICLVAHNGLRFDYPLLQSELQRLGKTLPENILCVDSYVGFKHIFSSIPYDMLPIYRKKKIVNEYRSQNMSQDHMDGTHSTQDHNVHEVNDISHFTTKHNELSDVLVEDTTLMQHINETTPQHPVSSRPLPDVLKLIHAKRRLFSDSETSFTLESYKLRDVYKFLTGKYPAVSHCAESDAFALMECITILGHIFRDWANKHAVPFSTIKKL